MKVVLILAGLCIVCSSLPSPHTRPDTDELIPMGTPMALAVETMGDAGFKTEFVQKGSFRYQSRDDSRHTHEQERMTSDHLLCCRVYEGTITRGGVTSVHNVVLALDDILHVTEILHHWDHTGL